MMKQKKLKKEKANFNQINTTFNPIPLQQVVTPDVPVNYHMHPPYQPPMLPLMVPQGNAPLNQPQFVPHPNMGIPLLSEGRPLIPNGLSNPQNFVNYPNLASQNDLEKIPQPIQYPPPTQSQAVLARDPDLIPAEQQNTRGVQGSEIPFYRVNMRDVEHYNQD